ncbi:hypothetical protein RJ641_000326 [Dillenia turbinata]|uniref:Uncharacterized protein n=1 Tax=Dillenia turbinata TaxID=194707 RepID=A0AAN8W601_9MAGN
MLAMGFSCSTFSLKKRKYTHLKQNATVQAWKFKSMATILNAGKHELKAWRMFIGFQNREILVSASGAVAVGGDSFPAIVENGTTLAGYSMADLKTAIETAGDFDPNVGGSWDNRHHVGSETACGSNT